MSRLWEEGFSRRTTDGEGGAMVARWWVIRGVGMRIAVSLMAIACEASAFERRAGKVEGGSPPGALASDCELHVFNVCSQQTWVYSDQEHAVWGTILGPEDC